MVGVSPSLHGAENCGGPCIDNRRFRYVKSNERPSTEPAKRAFSAMADVRTVSFAQSQTKRQSPFEDSYMCGHVQAAMSFQA